MENLKEDIENNSTNQPKIEYHRTRAIIVYRNLQLDAQNPTSPEVLVSVEKQPLILSERKSYANSAVLMDKESEKMKQLSRQAESLRVLPEIPRIKAVLELLSKNIRYAYKDVVADLYQENQELAKWVETNVSTESKEINIPFSEVIDKGYGVCSHLSLAYLWLTQKAGLEGTLMDCDHNTIRNITRTDTGEKLFRSSEIGQPVAAHIWVEIKTSDDKWIPVDPSTKLIGDTEENISMFENANYRGNANRGLVVDAEPNQLIPQNTAVSFKPGEATTQARYFLRLKSTLPITRYSVGSIPVQIAPTNEPYSGDGKLQIYSPQNLGVANLAILDVR